jgi:hypothetical protein
MKAVRNYTIQEFQNFVSGQLKNINDTQLLILKGHVLIEYTINCYLEAISKKENPDFFSRGFRFSDKVRLLEHFGDISTIYNKTIHEELYQLNDIRNDIAHDLEYKVGRIRSFITAMTKQDNEISKLGSDHYKLMGSIGILAGVIYGGYITKSRPEEFEKFRQEYSNNTKK